jgi:hypothetical protein
LVIDEAKGDLGLEDATLFYLMKRVWPFCLRSLHRLFSMAKTCDMAILLVIG